MQRTELAWAAGLFDGEGSTGAYLFNGGRQTYLRMQLRQNGHTQPVVLERFQRAVGGGLIHGPHRSKTTPQWNWVANGPAAYRVLRLLWPYLSDPKRDQANRAITKVNASIGAEAV